MAPSAALRRRDPGLPVRRRAPRQPGASTPRSCARRCLRGACRRRAAPAGSRLSVLLDRPRCALPGTLAPPDPLTPLPARPLARAPSTFWAAAQRDVPLHVPPLASSAAHSCPVGPPSARCSRPGRPRGRSRNREPGREGGDAEPVNPTAWPPARPPAFASGKHSPPPPRPPSRSFQPTCSFQPSVESVGTERLADVRGHGWPASRAVEQIAWWASDS